jgi:1-acyl-sn-glycerol-3-phosphate acyltransferase
MGDARIVPMSAKRSPAGRSTSRKTSESDQRKNPQDTTGTTPRTKPSTRTSSAGAAVSAGAQRAGGERERRRRRTTPLLQEPDVHLHAVAPDGPPGSLPEDASPSEIDQALAEAVAFLRRRLGGEYEVDEFGFDPEFADAVVMNLLRPLYKRWFRVEVRGIENIPSTGGALVVANHSGTIALDALMTQVAVHDEHPEHRHLRMLGADLVFALPFIGDVARRSGTTLAANPDAERLLSSGHLVGVWPEGFKGIGKPFSERYKLQRFGRGGFVSAALRTSTPIIPCAIVGAEEIYPIIGNMPTLARLLGLPYAPITPTWPLLGPLGLIPLPSKWIIEFGAPIHTDELGDGGAEDPMLVFDLTDQVRETIQQTLYSLLISRRSVFF